MKKYIIIVFFIVLGAIYNYFKHNFVIGNPVVNENSVNAFENNMLIARYLQLSSNKKVFDEIWLEKRAYISKNGIDVANIKSLKFSFKNNVDHTMKILKTNFNIIGLGFTNEIFIVETNDENLIRQDTLKITVLYESKRIDNVFLKMK